MNKPVLLDTRQLKADYGMSRGLVYNQMNQNGFPRQIKMGRSARWLSSEVDAWVKLQAKKREANHV